MSNTTLTNQEWLKVLGKGMVTLPKRWRDEMGIEQGAVVKAKKEGNKVIIEAIKSQNVSYRVYTSNEINEFLKDDELPKEFVRKVQRHLSTPSLK